MALFLLAACSARDPAPAASETAKAEEAPAGQTTGDSGQTQASAAIPGALLGRWGLVPADCTTQKGDEKGLMTIDADSLRFYESVATLKAVSKGEAGTFRGTFAYRGEGMEWQRDVAMKVAADGKSLVMEEFGADAIPGPQTYTRCS
ncbi:MAG: hypothetical protein JSR96_12765 [Proteobacteria bacterium]|nr:hypothetical protein [Pseudomonadota bacterium]